MASLDAVVRMNDAAAELAQPALEMPTDGAVAPASIDVPVDPDGYLRDRADWTPALATRLAAADGIVLGEPHWEIITFLQEYYEHYEIAPAIRILTKQIGKRFGKEKGNSRYLYELFPKGPAKQACRYAGLPKPTGCV